MNADRYSCQLPLGGFGQKSQDKLKNSKVLIVGMGGLGCPASLYLTSMGVGNLGIVDFDTVSRKNLHRQVLYSEQDVGKNKVLEAKKLLKKQNPEVDVKAFDQKITADNVMKIIEDYDIVVDCTDNFDTRYLLNDACVLVRKPLVYGAIFQYEGQASIWNVKNSDGSMSVNYRDIFPEVKDGEVPNCADGGVIPTIAGIIGCVQATEVVKYLTGIDDSLINKLLVFDAKSMTSYMVKLPKTSSAEIKELPIQLNIDEIMPNELRKKMADNIYELIDVRSREEHKAHNIGGKNIPLDEFEGSLNKINFKKPVVIYCASGVRSLIAAKIAKKSQLESRVLSLKGGINNW